MNLKEQKKTASIAIPQAITRMIVGGLFVFCVSILANFTALAEEEATEKSAASYVKIGIRSGGIVEVRGVLNSKDIARELLTAVRIARPDLELSVRHLKVNTEAEPLPILDQIPDFLEELSITTHEWEMWVTSGEFLVSGQTDSVVTHAAFQARLNLLRFEDENLRTRNLICLVSVEDFPKAPQYFPGALLSQDDVRLFPIVEEVVAALTSKSFQQVREIQQLEAEAPIHHHHWVPGFGLDNLQLLGLEKVIVDSRELGLLIADQLDWLFIGREGHSMESQKQPSEAIANTVLAAREAVEQPLAAATRYSLRARAAGKMNLVVLGHIPFSKQSFTVHLDQMATIKDIASQLQSGELADGDDILLSSRVGGTGTDAFNEWVSAKRVDQLKSALVNLGIPEERIEVELKAATRQDKNPHRVDILVPRRKSELRAQPLAPIDVVTLPVKRAVSE